MSDQPNRTADTPGQPAPLRHQPLFPVPKSWKIASVAAIIMVLLALVGIGMSNADPRVVATYWISLVPIYGLLCIATAWRMTPPGTSFGRAEITRQVLHWLGIAIALAVDYAIRGSGQEAGLAAGLNAMLLLALGCYLAGVHLQWLFGIVGVLLVVAGFVVVKFNEYMWLIFVVGAIAIACMIVFDRLFKSAHTQAVTTAQAGS
jgi:hypothetical protein